MPIGVLTNCAAVLVGGLLGTALGKILPPALKEHLPGLFGYCAIAIGVNSIIKASGMTAVVLAILVGFVVGHLLHLEHWTGRFFKKLVGMLHLGNDQIDMEFYITAVALFCCSGFGWYSALTEGITGDPSLLLSQDPVALDSVGADFLINQPAVVSRNAALEGNLGVQNYLHEAALASAPPSGAAYRDGAGNPVESLGVHEHWNNSVERLYSRDRGESEGIELVRILR
mgnify:CR=1 FL=1